MVIEINLKEKYRVMNRKQKKSLLFHLLSCVGIWAKFVPEEEQDKLFYFIAENYLDKYLPGNAKEDVNSRADDITRSDLYKIGK